MKIYSNSFFYNLADTPSLQPTQRSRLGDHHLVPDLAGVVLIMDGKLVLPLDEFFIQTVFDKPFDLNGDRLVHFITHYRPDQLSFHSSFFHSKSFWLSYGLVVGFSDDSF